MKKIYSLLAVFSLLVVLNGVGESNAQPTTAYDFTMNDCSGNMHHLFDELDSGNVVIMELFMLSCSPCVDAGNELVPMFENLKATCSNKIIFYHMGYTNSYTCSQIINWVSTNAYTSIPIDSGAIQTAWYGGMGMPTVAVVAGNTHKVLHTTVGYTSGDTAVIADSIRTFFGCSTVNVPEHSNSSSVSVSPNPSNGKFGLEINRFNYIEIFNSTGKRVCIYGNRFASASSSTLEIDISSKPDGIYFLRGEMNGESFSKKIILQK